MDPNDNNTLYYGTDRVYRTTNGAGSWTAISPDLTDGIPGTRLGTVTTIGVSPVLSNVIWAGTDDSHVWYTVDGGTNWTDVSLSLPYRWVTRVIPDPQNELTAYVTFSRLKWQDPQPHVFKTTDLGNTWIDISSNLPDAPVNAFAVDPINTDWLFVGTDLGAYSSSDGGVSWNYISPDLPIVSVYDMKIHPTGHFLVIGTHARSMYKMDLAFITSVNNEELSIVSDYILEQNYPNPFNPKTNIGFSIPKTEKVKIRIYNMAGQLINEIVNKEYSSGTHMVSWDGYHPTNVKCLVRISNNWNIKRKLWQLRFWWIGRRFLVYLSARRGWFRMLKANVVITIFLLVLWSISDAQLESVEMQEIELNQL